MIELWVLIFGRLVYSRHEGFYTFAYDLGIYNQAAWLASRGGSLFVTVRGLDFWGHHATVGLFLFAPFYRLGAGPQFLNLLQVLVLALGAVPVFLIARDRLGNEWLSVALAGAYLLHPVPGFLAWETFHPETVAITPLLFAWWLALRDRWTWFALSAACAVSFKEDVALAVAVLGLILVVRGRWRIGALTAGLALGWFLIMNQLVIPGNSPTGEVYYHRFFGELGSSPSEVIRTAFTEPSKIAHRLTAPDAKSFLWKLSAPYAVVPAFASPVVAIGVPQTAIDLLAAADHTREIHYHLAALPFAALTLGMIEGVALLGRRRASHRHFLVGLVVASAAASSMSWGLSPIGAGYKKGWWALTPDARQASKEAAVALVPSDAVVSSTYSFVPHLSSRRFSYLYPTPWVSHYWGVNGEKLPDPGPVEWMVVDRQQTDDAGEAVLDGLMTSGEFDVVLSRQDIVVARRARAQHGPSESNTRRG